MVGIAFLLLAGSPSGQPVFPYTDALPVKGCLTAATSLAHELVIATLDTREFAAAGVRLIDPARES